MTASVQLWRDHEDTVRELWWCALAAEDWLWDRWKDESETILDARDQARERRAFWRQFDNPESPPSLSGLPEAGDWDDPFASTSWQECRETDLDLVLDFVW